jgi:hypothetical protein
LDDEHHVEQVDERAMDQGMCGSVCRRSNRGATGAAGCACREEEVTNQRERNAARRVFSWHVDKALDLVFTLANRENDDPLVCDARELVELIEREQEVMLCGKREKK